MKILHINFVRTLVLSLVGFPATVLAYDLSWPSFQANLKPGESTVTQKVALPSTPITPPGKDVPDNIRGLSGRWKGWMCEKKSCFAAVDVFSLNANGGRFYHVYGEPDYFDPFPVEFDARILNGNELVGKSQGGPMRSVWVKIRLRPDGNADIMRWIDYMRWSRVGVLTRIP